MSVDDAQPTALTDSGYYDWSGPCLSPDGKWALLGSRDDTGGKMWRISVEQPNVVEPLESKDTRYNRVARNGEHLESPEHVQLSPDGRFVAFTATKPGRRRYYIAELHIMNIQTRETTQLTDLGMSVIDFSFSPDGKRIALVSHPIKTASELWLVDVDGQNLRRIEFDVKSE